MSVFPVPGGPKRSKPFGGPLSPVNISLRKTKHCCYVRENTRKLFANFLIKSKSSYRQSLLCEYRKFSFKPMLKQK